MRRRREARQARRQFRRLSRSLFGIGAGVMSPALLQEMARANTLLTGGQFDEAADLFEQLASGVEERGRPRRAGHLFGEAALALAMAGQAAQAVTFARQGVNLLQMAGRPRQAWRLADRVAAALRARGFNAEADSLLMPGGAPAPEMAMPAPTPPPRTLPAKCPHCSGAVRSDEVDWVDESSAECAFCGGVIKAVD